MFFSLSSVGNLFTNIHRAKIDANPCQHSLTVVLYAPKTARKSRTWSATCPVFSQISVKFTPRLNETMSGFDPFLRDLHSTKIASITLKGILFTWNYLESNQRFASKWRRRTTAPDSRWGKDFSAFAISAIFGSQP